jgi:tRNA(Ile2) C34 agmatinyltransferase TiaS
MDAAPHPNRPPESIFSVPCPGCGRELVPRGPCTYLCPDCGGKFHASLGYLVPLDAPPRKVS